MGPRRMPLTGRRVPERHGAGTAWWCPACACFHRGERHVGGYEPCPQAAVRQPVEAPAVIRADHLGDRGKKRVRVPFSTAGLGI